ncbi:acyltransferase [Neolewinella aurantiaca]|uniref:Acyltransferase n=1 Tax=Neolewinella aurantiaca TaxID=2602767 RepID=A0A5C7FSD4_9BACT|nr:acyltransferase [Neolewinella aurantiaca]TXF90958.1 acyltransferase [Neolewinella aurantiaca]
MNQLKSLLRLCQKNHVSFLYVAIRAAYWKLFRGLLLFAPAAVAMRIKGRIETSDRLVVGLGESNFTDGRERTILNIRGKLALAGAYSIGSGCRFDIGNDATVKIGKGGYINVNTTVVIMHGLTIGDQCVISWNCQFLDEDFHQVEYEGKTQRPKEITLGSHVWVGCGSSIYSGTSIPDGCIVASNSVVRGVFSEPNCIIGGNPAKIIKRNVDWK